MGDASDLQATEVVRITGADSEGKETYVVDATANHELEICDRLGNGGVSTTITVTSATAVEVKVGALARTERKNVQIQPLTGRVKWGWQSGSQEFTLAKDQFASFDVGPGTSIWIVAAIGSVDVAIGEVS